MSSSQSRNRNVETQSSRLYPSMAGALGRSRRRVRLHFESGFEPGDRRIRLVERRVPLVFVERLHLLDRVALDRRPHPLPHHPQQVHEDSLPEEVVHFVFTGGVSAHQPLHGSGFVTAVVIDMKIGKGLPPFHDEVHQAFELAPLPLAVEGPEPRVGPGRVRVAEEVFETRVPEKRRALDVEEDVAGRWFGKGQEALFRFGGQDQFAEPAFLRPRFGLDAGLFPNPLERSRARTLQLGVFRKARKGFERGRPRLFLQEIPLVA